MKVHFGLPEERLGPCALTMGSFDGVHLGHQAVLQRLVEVAANTGSEAAWITFDPHPRCVLDPSNCPKAITTLEEKLGLVRRYSIDHAIVISFTRELAELAAEDFVGSVQAAMRLRSLVAGYDFALGHNRGGDVAWLEPYGDRHGFEVKVVHPFRLDGAEVHSSDVRRLVTLGEVGEAGRLLGRPYTLAGLVEPGARVGRELGYPTVNLAVEPNKLVPGRGVYAGWARTPRGVHKAALSVGYRPTFDDVRLWVEAYLLDFDGDLYQQRVELTFVTRLRDEVRYDSREALVAQMDRDVEQTRALMEDSPRPGD